MRRISFKLILATSIVLAALVSFNAVTLATVVSPANQNITITTHAPSTASFNANFNVAATASSGLFVTITATGVCTIVDHGDGTATVTMTASTGTCRTHYNQAGNTSFKAAPEKIENTSAHKVNQVIVVTTPAPANAVFGTSFTVAATGGGSGNPVLFSASGPCTNAGPTFTMTNGMGNCMVKFNQSGNANYNVAQQVMESVQAKKANQTITVTTDAPANASFNSTFTPVASASSGLTVLIMVSGVCNKTGTDVKITSSTGNCTVKFNQMGNSNFNAAPQIQEVTAAQKATQTINFGSLPDQDFPASNFMVSATATSGLMVTFSADGSCTITGRTVHITGTGTCTITAHQVGSANYAAVVDVPQTFTISTPLPIPNVPG